MNTIRKQMLAAALSAAMLTIGDVVSFASNVYLSDEPVAEFSSASGVLTRDYVGNLVYEDGVLVKVLVEGGYVDMTGDSPEYMFYVTDHLGSVRVVADSDGNVRQVNHYYPYGNLIKDGRYSVSGSVDNRYRFCGKELNGDMGMYDFSARWQNPVLGRFTTMDPLAEKYYSVSPYTYCAGNPVNYVDPDGRMITVRGSKDFQRKFQQYRQYLTDNGFGNLFEKLDNSPRIYYIEESLGVSKMQFINRKSLGGTIVWTPDKLLETHRGLYLSPSVTLAHELGHANIYDEFMSYPNARSAYNDYCKEEDVQYEFRCERDAITGVEQFVSTSLGETPENVATRTSHSANSLKSIPSGYSPEQATEQVRSLNDIRTVELPRLSGISSSAFVIY